ncbi:MAG: septum formation initiator family protein [Deltaproteobacteria bacterium]|nr:septum formation initiator family protein [Deltaproteobacteria bacterium]
MTAFLVAVSIVIFGYTLLGRSALPGYWSLQTKKFNLEEKVASLETEVLEQRKKVNLLLNKTTHSKSYLEQIARNEYGFIGKKESLLLLQ